DFEGMRLWALALVNRGATRCGHATTTRDLRGQTGLASRGRPRALRASRGRGRQAHARRAVRRPQALGSGVARAGRSALPHSRRRGAAGGGPQRLEPGKSTRALLGCAHAPAPPVASYDLRPALVLPAVPP